MKKFATFVLIATLLFTFVACSGDRTGTPTQSATMQSTQTAGQTQSNTADPTLGATVTNDNTQEITTPEQITQGATATQSVTKPAATPTPGPTPKPGNTAKPGPTPGTTPTPVITVPANTKTTAPTVTSTSNPAADTVVIENFNSGSASSLVYNTDWSQHPAYGVGVSNIAVTNNYAREGKGLLVTMVQNTSSVQNLTLSGSKVTNAYQNGKKYFRMWVCNNANAQLGIGVVINNGSQICNYSVTNAKLTDAQGNAVAYNVGDPSGSGEGVNNAVYVPVGFSGWLAFETSQTVGHWANTNKTTKVTDQKSVTEVMLDVRVTGVTAGDTYVIDQVCLSDSYAEVIAQQPSVTPTTTTKPTESWEGKYLSFNGSKTTITVNADSKNTSAEFATFTFSSTASLTFNSPIEYAFNYYGIVYKSTQPLWMYVQYVRNGSAYEELCFLDATSSFKAFNSLIDGAIDNLTSRGAKITGYRFENRGSGSATVVLSSGGTAQYTNLQQYVYLQNEYLQIGADLVYGGALAYLEYIKEPVALVNMNGRAEIGLNYAGKVSASAVKNQHVNLLNNYDPGRLVQQSFYGTDGSNDDYTPGNFMGNKWSYNPVMGGDCGGYHSKIVDVVVANNSIYVKSRPMDWGKKNSPTYSYMEATYTLQGCNVIVSNRFTDYSDYKHPVVLQELPAFYVSEPLYRLVHYDGNAPWTHGNFKTQDDLPFWDGVWPRFDSTENWWAWVNGDTENPFGLGLYVPGVTQVTGGIYKHNGAIGNDSAKSDPTSYIAPLRWMAIKNYKPIEYSYAITCGTLAQIRGSIYQMKNDNTINNNSLLNY